MLGQQLGQDLILALHLLLQELNPFLLLGHLAVGTFLGVGGGSAVLEELFLPTVENRWLQTLFFTQIRDWNLIQKVPPQNSNFLFSSVVFALFAHTFAPLF